MSTTRGYPASSRSSTVHCVEAPVALFVTVRTVPKANVGLAHVPAGASEYHVASPTSWLVGAGGGRAVVVVGGGGGAVVVVVGGGGGGTVVVVVGGAVVVVDCGAWYATRCDGRSTPSRCDGGYTRFWFLCDRNAANAVPNVVAGPRDACDFPLCSKRKGRPNNAPQSIAATPRRLPRVLCFRRAPPFSGDSAPAPTDTEAGEGFWRS
jgi:hypothetical protein